MNISFKKVGLRFFFFFFFFLSYIIDKSIDLSIINILKIIQEVRELFERMILDKAHQQ